LQQSEIYGLEALKIFEKISNENKNEEIEKLIENRVTRKISIVLDFLAELYDIYDKYVII
jgi:hypothetical protein